ncbi:MAG: hypothetical protein U0350_24530 [Caldilineaceae bacterium]
MTFPVLIETNEGQVTASLVGVSKVQVVKPTRSQAIQALKEKIEQQIELGELLSLNIDSVGVSSLQGKYTDDLTLREICAEAYALRDAEQVE